MKQGQGCWWNIINSDLSKYFNLTIIVAYM
nr:MAG TPA: hypothetical protein [Bacteriophage sp.]